MKKLLTLTLITALALGFNACKKSSSTVDGTNFLGNTSNTTTAPAPVDPLALVGSLPADYTKKVVLEEFTGEWCGWCPEGAKVMVDNIAAHPGKVIGISVHDGDPMEIPSYNTWIKALTGVTGFPNGSVDRADASDRGNWTSQINTELAKTSKLGIAMVTKTKGNLASVTVYIGYKTAIPAGAKLTLAVIEDKVPQTSGGQSNYSTSVVVDANWQHSHVLRGLVTANDGDAVDLTSPKKYTIVEFKNVDLSTMNIKNMANVQFAAFINVNSTPRDILNAQEAGFNETKKWD